MTIINTLHQSADQSNTPDDRVGYGIPDAKKAFVMLQKMTSSSSATFGQCHVNVNLNLKVDSSMNVTVERILSGESTYTNIHQFHSDNTYGLQSFHYDDNLYGRDMSSAKYRYKVAIGTDTAYYLDSSALAIDIDCSHIPPANNSILIAPNPFQQQISITIARTEKTALQICIFNAAGQKVYVENSQQDIGTYIKNINSGNWSKGIYVIQIYANGQLEYTQRVVKL
jgi:hypothetical protein